MNAATETAQGVRPTMMIKKTFVEFADAPDRQPTHRNWSSSSNHFVFKIDLVLGNVSTPNPKGAWGIPPEEVPPPNGGGRGIREWPMDQESDNGQWTNVLNTPEGVIRD